MKLLLIILLISILSPQSDHYRLTINVSGLSPLKGNLYISLHDRPEYFQVADSALMKKRIAINEETEVISFNNVPAGKYAIAIYHDENLNGVMDSNEKGFPLEGYGFSTKNKMFGRPKFEQAAFDLNRNDTIEIGMIYPKVAEQKREPGR